MADYRMDVVSLAKASTDYDTRQQSIYSTLNQMQSEIEAAQQALKGAAVNAFSACKAEWDEGASDLHQVLDKTGASLGVSARETAANETAMAQGFKAGVVASAGSVYDTAAGNKLAAGQVLTTEPTNITYKGASVGAISTQLSQGRTKLQADLDQIDAIARATASYWEAGSQTNYQSFHTKTQNAYHLIDDAINQMQRNATTWDEQSSAVETANANRWGG